MIGSKLAKSADLEGLVNAISIANLWVNLCKERLLLAPMDLI